MKKLIYTLLFIALFLSSCSRLHVTNELPMPTSFGLDQDETEFGVVLDIIQF